MPSEPTDPSSAKRATLFLSYSRTDEPQARRLAAALEQAGYTVWWDALIEGGASYARSIGSALEKADAVLVLWSASSIESDWVRDEAAQGRDRHRLVPLSLDGSKPPLGFRQYQVIDVSHWHGRRNSQQFAEIERAIAAAMGHEAPVRPGQRSGISRRSMVIGGSAAAAGAAGGGLFLAWNRGLFGMGGEEIESIAVLPFKNLSGDPAQDYFSEGLTEEVRAALVRLSALKVVGGTSSEAAAEEEGDAKAVAGKLGVGFLLGGSVRRSGDIVRIATDLTDRSGFSRWSTTVNKKLTDIFAVQGEIARMVAQALSVQIATESPATGGTRNVEAYEQYLRGRSLFNLAKDEASDRAALAHYDLALAADPKFAMAHAARSRVIAALAVEYGKAHELKPLYAEAVAAAERAVKLAPNLAEAQLALGYVLFAGRLDVKGARPNYDRAYQLGRGDADVVLLYALYCSRAGRAAEARDAGRRAIALDPLNARAHRAAGSIDYAARRFAEAISPLRRSLELNPKITNAHSLIGFCLMQLGKLAEARKEFEAEPTEFFRLSGLAIVERKMGNRPAAQQAMAELTDDVGDSALYQQAQVLAQWGEVDEAVRRLVRARQVGDSGLIYLATDPLLDPARNHPEFISLMRELNLS